MLLSPLSACVAPYEAMKNNQYSQIDPSSPPQEIVGTWTGTSGPYLMTIRVDQDGRGLYCSSWHTNESINNLKYSGGRLYFPDGMTMTAATEGGQLIASYDQKGVPPVRLSRDGNLVEASPYCKEKLR